MRVRAMLGRRVRRFTACDLLVGKELKVEGRVTARKGLGGGSGGAAGAGCGGVRRWRRWWWQKSSAEGDCRTLQWRWVGRGAAARAVGRCTGEGRARAADAAAAVSGRCFTRQQVQQLQCNGRGGGG